MRTLWLRSAFFPIALWAIGCSSVVTLQDAGNARDIAPGDAGVDVPLRPDGLVPGDVPPPTDVAPPTDVPPTPSGCNEAAALAIQATVRVNVAGSAESLGPCEGSQTSGGVVRWLQVDVAGLGAVEVNARRIDRAQDVLLRAYQDCPATACVASSSSSPDSGVATTRLYNPTPSLARYFLAVGAAHPDATAGLYSVTANYTAVPPNRSCDGAYVLRDGSVLSDQDTAGLPGSAPRCGSANGGAPLWYLVTVPIEHTLVVTATSDASYGSPVIRFHDACPPSACLAISDIATDGHTATARFVNPRSTPVGILVAIGSAAVGLPVRFELRVSLARTGT